MEACIVMMPTASIRPTLGPALLKAQLEREGHQVVLVSGNLAFARKIGTELYQWVSEVSPPEAMLGEWLFTPLIEVSDEVDPYLRSLSEKFPNVYTPEMCRAMLAVRRQAVEFMQNWRDWFPMQPFDFVGCSTNFAQTHASVALLREIRSSYPPDTLLVLGGANCDSEMAVGLMQMFEFVDLAFSGESELSLGEVARRIDRGERLFHEVPGVIARDTSGQPIYTCLQPMKYQDLNELPFPDYSDFFREYAEFPAGSRAPGVPIETSRGCWWGEKHNCTFCGLNGMSMAYRSKSPQRAIQEIDRVQSEYFVRDVHVVDNILDTGHLREVMPELATREWKPSLFYEVKANLSWSDVKLLRDAGVVAMQPGIESLDSSILKLMDKGIKAIQNIELLRHCRELGIWPHWNILYGFPGESMESYGRMAELVSLLTHLDPPDTCQRFRLERFSPLYNEWQARGLANVRPQPSFSYLFGDGEGVELYARYFDHEYADGRVPEEYCASLVIKVAEWQKAAASAFFTYEQNGQQLKLTDGRGTVLKVAFLDGWQARLYLHCLEARGRRQLQEFALANKVDVDEVARVLKDFVRRGWAVGMDARYLCLATDRVETMKHKRKPSWVELSSQLSGQDS